MRCYACNTILTTAEESYDDTYCSYCISYIRNSEAVSSDKDSVGHDIDEEFDNSEDVIVYIGDIEELE